MTTRRDNPRDNEARLAETEERKRRIDLRKQTLKSDRRKLLRMPEFQRVMSDVLGRGGMFHSCMTGNSNTFHLSGRQDFTREIFDDMIDADPDAGFELLKATKFGEDDV